MLDLLASGGISIAIRELQNNFTLKAPLEAEPNPLHTGGPIEVGRPCLAEFRISPRMETAQHLREPGH